MRKKGCASRFKRPGKKQQKDKHYKPEEDSIQEQEVYQDQKVSQDQSQDQQVYQDQSKSSKKQKIKKNKSKSKKRGKNSYRNQSLDQSQLSQVMDIRNADESTREHIRPAFIKRWDGISNELELTPSELRAISPMLQVYWKVKSKNMNVIVFLQFGKMQFYAFEDDAIKLNEMFKKRLKKFSKFLMVNFWYKQIEAAKRQLFKQNIPVMIMNEIDDPQYRQLNGLVRRQVVQVQTPGLHLNIKDASFRERVVAAFFKRGNRFGVVVLDGENNHFYVEQVDDDEYLHEIRRVVNRYRPVEVVLPNKNHKEIAQIVKQICNPYMVELNLRFSSVEATLSKFESSNISLIFKNLIEAHKRQKPESDEQFSRFHTVSVLALIYQYLESLSLCQKIFYQGLFQESSYNKTAEKPFFDSQVYQNLQIFSIRNEDQGYGKPGTLVAYLDRCKTVQGKKMMRKWIDQPLLSFQQIKERQDAIKQLVENKEQVLNLHEKMSVYQKFENRIADIYHWVIRNSERGKLTLTRQINYEKQYDQRKNPAIVRLKQILQILKLFKQYEQFLKEIRKFNLKSKYLQKQVQLLDLSNIHVMSLEQISKIEGLPQIGYVAESIMRKFNFDEETNNLEPVPGLNQIFDHEKQEIQIINRQLNEELQKWKKYFNNEKVVFVSVRAKNEVQVPKVAIKSKVHPDLIFSSQVSGSIRYTTPRTYQLSEQLMEHQTIISQTFQPFLQQIVHNFCSFRYLWDLYVQSIAKIDVLMSLAKVSKDMTPRCLPEFNQNRLFIKKGFHASLLQVKSEVIPNTLSLNKNERLLLLTGPNMGGKSTLLKQTCILAIMAQIGCYVPAEQYHSIIFDQIFCRIGASDRIYEGKSTFYVELQQTKRIINQATSSSLIIIDELGRGTSTYDGMAIAEATMDYLLKQIGAFTLFSTHYSQITKKFENTPQVRLMKMASELNGEDLVFTYQLVDGVAERSFAGNVGKMVGICPQILKLAQSKSEQMHHESRKKKQLRQAFHMVYSDISFKKQKARTNYQKLMQEE